MIGLKKTKNGYVLGYISRFDKDLFKVIDGTKAFKSHDDALSFYMKNYHNEEVLKDFVSKTKYFPKSAASRSKIVKM